MLFDDYADGTAMEANPKFGKWHGGNAIDPYAVDALKRPVPGRRTSYALGQKIAKHTYAVDIDKRKEENREKARRALRKGIMNKGSIDIVMKEMDKDNSGTVEFSEFMHWLDKQGMPFMYEVGSHCMCLVFS